jgi:hypothetical protein
MKTLNITIVYLFLLFSCYIDNNGVNAMEKESIALKVKVLNAWKIEKYDGQAILAGVKPRFVVALLIRDSDENYKIDNSNANFKTHRVVFFAIDSLVKLFLDSDIEGNNYDLIVDIEDFKDKKLFYLRLR